ncbi:MAG: tetratricopeptide repeat protein [Armatimonadetes bacterium]|nr:tetratricopeptide repeat protein [Armatimonadota bacterium]
MRHAAAPASLVALVVLGGCGAIGDMRSQYVANRALREASAELTGDSPRLDRARRSLDLAYRLRRGDPRFLARLAEPYQAAGGFDRAIRCYEAAEEVYGGTHEAQVAYCLLKLGKTEAGAERALEAVRAASDDLAAQRIGPERYANVLNDVGYALVDAKVQLDEGAELIEEAVRLQPTVPAHIDSLGWAYYRRGEYADAAFHLERAARLMGRRNPEVLWHLGAVHAQLGKLRRAESELRQALELEPANEEARRTLRHLLRELPPPATV